MDAAGRALEYVEEGQTLGLGTGRAATEFVRALGARVKEGLRVRGVPTSEATAALAGELGIPLLTLEEAGTLDICFDGADEVDPDLQLIKGYGGALVREKIVAAFFRRFIVLVGAEKLVERLGQRGILPVEIVPFAEALCRTKLVALGCEPNVRMRDGERYVTDNGNWIHDCKVSGISDPRELDRRILSIPGVVGTGLFVDMAEAVVIQDGDAVEVRERKSA